MIYLEVIEYMIWSENKYFVLYAHAHFLESYYKTTIS